MFASGLDVFFFVGLLNTSVIGTITAITDSSTPVIKIVLCSPLLIYVILEDSFVACTGKLDFYSSSDSEP